MARKRTQRLDMAVEAIQQRWGTRALRKAAKPRTIPHIPTSFEALDQALGIGGIPRGRVTEMLGAPTSGMSTLALKTASQAQSKGDTIIYLDLAHTFDPDYADRCGVNLSQLILARPHSGLEGLEIAWAFVADGSAGLIIFDSIADLLLESRSHQALSTTLRQLVGALANSLCALVFLTPLYFGDAASASNYPSGFALAHYASLRLLIQRARWITYRSDIVGYQAEITTLKNKMAPMGAPTKIDIRFDGIVQGNGA